jgi:acyl-coenzyme A thioesterase PaaI-like protein
MTQTYALYRKLSRMPGGRLAFSLAFARKAPYFGTVRPRVREVRPNHAELTIANRKAVHNHIGTVHAIAVCNGLEAAMGLLAEATIPSHRRWLPKGLEVAYLAKSTTDLLCIAETDASDWADGLDEVRVRVKAVRTDGVVVVEGVIPLHVTDKPAR